MPIPRGGGARLADALVALIRRAGRHVRDRRPRRASVRAAGVRTAAGETITAARAVDLQRDADPALRRAARRPMRGAERFRYGRSEMQIHFALSEPPRWEGDERLGGTAIVHLTPGLDGVSRAVNEAERGLLPGRGDGRRRAAADDGSLACARTARASSGSSCRSCRGGSRATPPASSTSATGRGRRPARALRRPHPGAARAAHPEPRVVDPRPRRRSRRPICRRRTSTSSTATRTAARSRSTRTSSGDRSRATGARTPVDGRLAHRRVDASRPGARRRQRRARRAAAARAAAPQTAGREAVGRSHSASASCSGRVRCGHSRTSFERGSRVLDRAQVDDSRARSGPWPTELASPARTFANHVRPAFERGSRGSAPQRSKMPRPPARSRRRGSRARGASRAPARPRAGRARCRQRAAARPARGGAPAARRRGRSSAGRKRSERSQPAGSGRGATVTATPRRA